MPKAYSYLRFSTPEQLKGDSFRRQTEAAQGYAQKHKLSLDTELTFQDMGVSAFRGANAVEGALGKFIEAVDGGRVARGSFLLVENLDRLSRDKIMPALNRFASLLEKGITVVTLSDGKAYDANSLNNLPDLMLSLLIMSRAHEESELKSRRLKAAWQAKRDRAAQDGHKLTSMCPAWLRLRNGSFEVIPDRSRTVRRIYEMALEGHGVESIARFLNEDGVKPFFAHDRRANGWYPSYVRKILCNPAVIGQFQPMRRLEVDGKRKREADGPVIEGYFPAIVDEATFYRVKRAKPGVSGKKGREVANILSGLVFCSRCGGKLHYVNKGAAPKGGSYLACDNARRKRTCDAQSVRYNVVRGLVFHTLDGDALNIRQLVDLTPQNRLRQLQERKEAIEGTIAHTEQAITNLLDSLQRVPSPAIEQRLAQQEQTLAAQQAFHAAVTEKIQGLSGESYEDELRAVLELVRILESGDKASIAQTTVRLNAALKRAIERIEVELTATKETHVRITVPNGKGFLVGAWKASGRRSWRFVVGDGDGEEGSWKGPFAAVG